MASQSVTRSLLSKPTKTFVTSLLHRSFSSISTISSSFISRPSLSPFNCVRALSSLLTSGLSNSRSFATSSTVSSANRNIRDQKRRTLAAKYELRRNLYKAFCRDPDLPSDIRDKHRYKLSKLPRNSAFVRVRNRCIFTGRPRSVYEKFRMSRIVFRTLANQGQLMGIKKASW